MATILKVKNLQYICNCSTDDDKILHEHADCGYKPCEKLKFAYFKYSKWQTVVILEIENWQYLCNRSTDCNKISHRHTDYHCKLCGKLQLAYFSI